MTEYLLSNNRKLECTKARVMLKEGDGRTLTSNDVRQPVEVMVHEDMLYIHAEAMSDNAATRNELDSRVVTYAYPLGNIAEFEFVLAKDFDKDLLLLRQSKEHEAEQTSKDETDTPDTPDGPAEDETDTPDTPDGPAEPIQQELAAPLRWWRKLTGRA